jgi:hypothetical protein
VARATGLEIDIPDDAVETVMATMRVAVSPEMRAAGFHGSEQPAPEDASTFDRLAAFMAGDKLVDHPPPLQDGRFEATGLGGYVGVPTLFRLGELASERIRLLDGRPAIAPTGAVLGGPSGCRQRASGPRQVGDGAAGLRAGVGTAAHF